MTTVQKPNYQWRRLPIMALPDDCGDIQWEFDPLPESPQRAADPPSCPRATSERVIAPQSQ